tara:strand:+ start:144 stop:473 length:330 start_codon:yes stop_codon:yes gene_type:complete
MASKQKEEKKDLADGTTLNTRRRLTGKVVSDKMDKTITVEINRQVKHRIYKKYYVRTKKFKAHDEKNEAKSGDLVRIIETRPISKSKRWALQTVIRKAPKIEELKEQVQ